MITGYGHPFSACTWTIFSSFLFLSHSKNKGEYPSHLDIFQIWDDGCEGVCFFTRCLLFFCFVELIFEGGKNTFVIQGKQVWQRVAEYVVLIMDASRSIWDWVPALPVSTLCDLE